MQGKLGVHWILFPIFGKALSLPDIVTYTLNRPRSRHAGLHFPHFYFKLTKKSHDMASFELFNDKFLFPYPHNQSCCVNTYLLSLEKKFQCSAVL